MRKASVCVLLGFILFLSGCNDRIENGGLNVVAPIEPVKFIIEQILQDKGNATSLLSSNQDAHSSETMPILMKTVASSDLIFFLGTGIEFEERNKVALIENAKDVSVVLLSENFDSLYDPHIWVSLKNIKIIAYAVCEALSAYDRENAGFYTKNCEDFISKANYADSALSSSLSERKIKRIFTDHTAFSYLASDYLITQTGLFSEGKDISIKDISSAVNEMKADSDRIFILTSNSNEKYAEIFKRDADAHVIFFNPLSEDIISEFLKLAKSLKND